MIKQKTQLGVFLSGALVLLLVLGLLAVVYVLIF